MHWVTFSKGMKITLKWYVGHVVILPASCILHVGTLLSFSKLIPSLIICRYALRRWRDLDSGLHDHIGSWEHLFHFLSYCTFYIIVWTLLHLFTHVSPFWSGYVVYHFLGKDGIRLYISFTLLVWITFEVWQPDTCGYAHLDTLYLFLYCFMFNYENLWS